ncbi:RagB/SusD family nutrient uptake outer membrane protein [Zunongwangia pacifica]|uniref:RagB/SusD family nutrient uptake outer membrane protein n=1 Tax=Zunongwangia pacifica TaxID=2911062 RepID=A0A9X2CLV7_9FLAO|nr:RagB/SusD family nutrient uptake outer membrane protein [Zunongwangia pacifica]MCL6220456.1 RagB/SusD family nutrient uptake outer membrane protein [Zunongwangia pacifica]
MKNIKIIFILLIAVLTGCSDDLLNKEPLSEVTEDNFFTKASDLQLYTNGFYRMLPSTSIYNGDARAGNILETTLSEEMRSARTIPTTGGGWDWGYLRDINYFLENYQRGDDAAAIAHYGGVARFFRAYFYFNKLQRFGAVPYYDYTINPDDQESLQKPRDSRQFIVDKILADLTIAIEDLNEDQQLYTVTKYAALALKSRVGLYEGTYEKYRGISGYETYLEASIDASKELMNNSPYGVFSSGNPNSDYLNLFNSHDAVGAEVILAREFNTALDVDHNVNYYTTTSSYGRPGMPKDLVNTYLNADGSRFTDLPDYNQIFFTEEVANRDPRLSQTIRTPGYTRKGQAQELPPNLGATVTGYQIIKYVTEPQYDTNDQSITDLPIFRFGEILLNFAEAKAELGTATQTDIDNSINVLRDRVAMPHLVIEAANNDPDPYMQNQYPQVKGNNAGLLLEIRRERRIELYMENFFWDDIVRWKAGQFITRPLRGLYVPGPGEYDFEGDGDTDVVFYEGDAPGNQVEGIQYLKLGSDVYLSDNNLIDPQPNFNNRSFNENKDYLYPIPRIELQLNPNLEQNPGWE